MNLSDSHRDFACCHNGLMLFPVNFCGANNDFQWLKHDTVCTHDTCPLIHVPVCPLSDSVQLHGNSLGFSQWLCMPSKWHVCLHYGCDPHNESVWSLHLHWNNHMILYAFIMICLTFTMILCDVFTTNSFYTFIIACMPSLWLCDIKNDSVWPSLYDIV